MSETFFYTYKKINGYYWNLIQKIMVKTNNVFEHIELSNSQDDCKLIFPRRLTKEEKKIVDNIMEEENPTDPVFEGTVFCVNDLWAMREWYKKQFGKKFNLWFERDDDKDPTHIYIQFPEKLTEEEKKKVIEVYQQTIRVIHED